MGDYTTPSFEALTEDAVKARKQAEIMVEEYLEHYREESQKGKTEETDKS